MKLLRLYAVLLVAVCCFASAHTLAAAGTAYDTSREPLTAATSSDASYNWSGYVADSGSYSAVSASWIVPAVTTDERLAADATWVGIGGVSSNDLIQAGTQALVQSDGATQYEAWYETLPEASQPVPLNISAGDSVSVNLTSSGSGAWRISFIDNTSGAQYALDVPYASLFSSAEWVQEMPAREQGSLIPLDNFGSLAFTDASTIENGETMTPSQAGAMPLRMISAAGATLAEPTVLSDSGDFTVMRTDAVAIATPALRSQRSRF